jgi:hypothetical protein
MTTHGTLTRHWRGVPVSFGRHDGLACKQFYDSPQFARSGRLASHLHRRGASTSRRVGHSSSRVRPAGTRDHLSLSSFLFRVYRGFVSWVALLQRSLFTTSSASATRKTVCQDPHFLSSSSIIFLNTSTTSQHHSHYQLSSILHGHHLVRGCCIERSFCHSEIVLRWSLLCGSLPTCVLTSVNCSFMAQPGRS